jgi:hypothetical protein
VFIVGKSPSFICLFAIRHLQNYRISFHYLTFVTYITVAVNFKNIHNIMTFKSIIPSAERACSIVLHCTVHAFINSSKKNRERSVANIYSYILSETT